MKKLLNIYLQEDKNDEINDNLTKEDENMDSEVEEGTCGYSVDGESKKKPAGPHLMRERFKKLAGLKPLYEQSFDDRLKAAGGFSDEEFDDITSKDPGEPFPGDDELTIGYSKARDLISKLRQDYRNMSDEDLDEFSKEMVLHFLDNTTAAAAAKIHFNKKGI